MSPEEKNKVEQPVWDYRAGSTVLEDQMSPIDANLYTLFINARDQLILQAVKG